MTAFACQQALEAAFKADPAVRLSLGNPARIYDAPVKLAAYPFAVWRRWETRSADASGVTTHEHIATIEVVCRQSGAEDARKAVAALAACASGPRPSASGARIVLVLPVYSDVMRAVDGRTWLGIVRLRIIAEVV